jgi:predicted signal transduction protein with EAL and GGDEF domain
MQRYGRGLRSIQARFTLLVALCTAAGVAGMLVLDGSTWLGGPSSPAGMLIGAATIAAAGALTFVLAGKLVANIVALKASTDAVIAGDMDKPVEVDCECEVGGLADSFRRMVERLNSNILRMNVLAYHDAITGLSNRAVVEHVLARALDGSCAPTPVTVLFMDLDGFKRVNDTFGHGIGDELLRQVAHRVVTEAFQRTRETIDSCTTAYGELADRPPKDLVFGRFAGDEFIAIIPGLVDENTIRSLCDAVHLTLARPFAIGGAKINVGVSIGVARAPLDSSCSQQILVDADMAMYAAKERERGKTVFFHQALRDRLTDRNTLEAELRAAIDNDELVVHYQPKYDTKTLRPIGYEALVRWQHPRLGLLLPGRFLDTAEQKNMMCDIGAAVFVKVLAQMTAWQAQGHAFPVAINVSPSQFRNPELCERMRQMLAKAQVDPRLIEIEITEHVAMEDAVAAEQKLAALKAIGVKLVIDDFGIGYSNLTQLVNLPFDVLKIDRSLVNEIGVSTRSEVVIESLVLLAHRMGHLTVAEGVERTEQIEFLRKVGCDSLQGFLLSRPLPAEALAWHVRAEQARQVA